MSNGKKLGWKEKVFLFLFCIAWGLFCAWLSWVAIWSFSRFPPPGFG